jgi:hypothetical protein
MATRHTYYGAHVRIEHRASGLDGSLVVQKQNPLSGGWIDARSFYEYENYCHTDARQFASALAAELTLEE